jgi:hypothetical protein
MKKIAKIGPNGGFERFLDVFGVFMTKKCTETKKKLLQVQSNSGGGAHPFTANPGGLPPFVPPKVTAPPVPPCPP